MLGAAQAAVEHHLLPAHSDDAPAGRLEIGVPATVTPQRSAVAVVGEAFALEDDPQRLVVEVDPAEEAAARTDRKLRTEAGHAALDEDRPAARLERIVSARIEPPQAIADPPRTETPRKPSASSTRSRVHTTRPARSDPQHHLGGHGRRKRTLLAYASISLARTQPPAEERDDAVGYA